jgi:carotenoid cleavage dioxygenase-like enzyme
LLDLSTMGLLAACLSLLACFYVKALDIDCGSYPGPRVENCDALATAWTTSAWGEILTEKPLAVSGELPSWLTGEYFLASAAGYEISGGRHNLTHAFDGFSKILRWRFRKGQAPSLRARLLQSEWLGRSRQKGDVVPSSTVGGVSPPFSKAEKMKAPWANSTDNFNVNVHRFAPNVFAVLSDVSDPKAAAAQVDADTLSSEDFAWKDVWSDAIADRIAPAHPRIVPDGSNDTVGLIVRLNPMAATGIGDHSLLLYRTNASGTDPLARTLLHKVKLKHLPYVHSIGVTSTHAIVCSGPLHWDVNKLLSGTDASTAWEWDAGSNSSTIYAIPLDSKQPVQAYTAPPFFGFHHLNAWHNADGTLTFDVLVNQNLSASNSNPASAFALNVLRDPTRRDVLQGKNVLTRYTLPQTGGKASVDEFSLLDADGKDSPSVELPSFNRAVAGLPYQFAYFWAPQAGGDPRWSTMALLKKDLRNDSVPVIAWQRDGHFPGEATFVGRPGSKEEDEGVLLAAVHNGTSTSTRSACYLIVLNASTMRTLAELTLPGFPAASQLEEGERLLAFGLHGLHSQ